MSEKRIFNVGYIEYPQTTLIYRSVKINVSNYPELKDMTDNEIVKYVKENAYQMKANDDFYDSLGEELSDQDIIREKTSHIGSDFWAELTEDDEEDDDDNDDDDDE